MKKRLLLLSSIALFLSCNLDKVDDKEPLPTFETHFVFDSNKTVEVESVVEAHDDGYVISGQASDINFNITSMFLVKTSITGGVLKKVTDFGSLGITSGGYLAKVTDGYIVVGTEYSGTDLQVLVSKFKPDLSKAWTQVFGKTDHDEVAGGVEIAASGDIIIAASNGPASSTESDPFFLKIRPSDGTMLDSQTVSIDNFGRFQPRSIARNGNVYGVTGYNQGVSIPISFSAVIGDDLSGLTPYNGSLSSGNGSGVVLAGSGGGFVHVDGLLTQITRQAFIETLDGNGELISSFDQFTEIAETGFLGGCRTPLGKYVACGWGADVLGTDERGIAGLYSADISTEATYQFEQNGKLASLSAAGNVSDGGFVLAGFYDNGKEILLVKLNDKFELD